MYSKGNNPLSIYASTSPEQDQLPLFLGFRKYLKQFGKGLFVLEKKNPCFFFFFTDQAHTLMVLLSLAEHYLQLTVMLTIT